MSAIATTAARIGTDLRALGARAVEEVADGIKVTFSTDAQRYSVMGLLRDEVDGVRLIGDHALEGGRVPTLSPTDVMHVLGGGEVGQVAYAGLEGVEDIVFSQTLRGTNTLTVRANGMERADSLRRLLRDEVAVELPGAEAIGYFDVKPTNVRLDVQTNGIYG